MAKRPSLVDPVLDYDPLESLLHMLEPPLAPYEVLAESWQLINEHRFAGTLPILRIAWAQNLPAPARIERPILYLDERRMVTEDPAQTGATVLLQAAMLVHTYDCAQPMLERMSVGSWQDSAAQNV